MKARLCIDIDNVIARTDEVMRGVIRDYTEGRVDFRYEDIKEFDYWLCKDRKNQCISRHQWRDIHELFSEPRYLWLIQPFGRVQETLRGLSEKYSLHITSSRLRKAQPTTIEWLQNHDFPDHSIHFVQHGEKHATLGEFHAAVEDHYEQAVSFANAGTPCYLVRHPWNEGRPIVPSVHWVEGWSELANILSR